METEASKRKCTVESVSQAVGTHGYTICFSFRLIGLIKHWFY